MPLRTIGSINSNRTVEPRVLHLIFVWYPQIDLEPGEGWDRALWLISFGRIIVVWDLCSKSDAVGPQMVWYHVIL